MKILFVIVPIFIIIMFVFTFAMIFSPKLRGKMLSKQIKATKYMLDDVGEDLEDLGSNAINIKSNILSRNEQELRNISSMEANIEKEKVRTISRAIKEGFSDTLYCKHCGEVIAGDSKYCSYCGKKQ